MFLFFLCNSTDSLEFAWQLHVTYWTTNAHRINNIHLWKLHQYFELPRMKPCDVRWVANLWDWRISFLSPSRLPKTETREHSLQKMYDVLLHISKQAPVLIFRAVNVNCFHVSMEKSRHYGFSAEVTKVDSQEFSTIVSLIVARGQHNHRL